jgi:hypothetical protein
MILPVQDSSVDLNVTAPRRPFRPAVLALVALLAPLGLVLAPRDGAAVIVMASDSRRAAEAVAHAGGAIMTRFGAYGLIAHSDNPGFATRLYQSGALLVLDGAGSSACLSGSKDI